MKKEMSQDRVFNIIDNIFYELTDTEELVCELHNKINPVLLESESIIVKDTDEGIVECSNSKVSANLKIVLERIIKLKSFLEDIKNKIIL